MSAEFGRKVILWTLVVSLSGQPLTGAANQQVVGKVVRSSGASMGGARVFDGETIVAGDVLSTTKSGGALVKFSATTQASLGEETTVLFRKNAGRVLAEVTSGKLEMDTLGPESPIVQTSDYKMEPAEPGKAIYLVAVSPDKNTAITARRGKISIKEIGSGRSYLLPEGYMAVPAGSSAAPGQEKEEPKQAPGAPTGPTTEEPPKVGMSSGTKTLIIIAAVGAAAGIGLAVAASGGGGAPASPSGP